MSLLRFSFFYVYILKPILEALLKEIVFQKTTYWERVFKPFTLRRHSLLDKEALKKVMDSIDRNFNITSKAEITLEANPDDLTSLKVKDLKQTAINRLSIGCNLRTLIYNL